MLAYFLTIEPLPIFRAAHDTTIRTTMFRRLSVPNSTTRHSDPGTCGRVLLDDFEALDAFLHYSLTQLMQNLILA